MQKPVIGVTSPLDVTSGSDMRAYEAGRHVDLLRHLGAQAFVLSRSEITQAANLCQVLDGVLFSGGGDVSTTLYGGRAELGNDRVDEGRDEREMKLFLEAFDRKMPILCVCRGLQLANVTLGGTLIEDIKSELGERYTVAHHQVRELNQDIDMRTHAVQLAPGSFLHTIADMAIVQTNSVHHQAIRALAPCFRTAATAEDGIIEAIELVQPDFFFQGVQWHPEALPSDTLSRALYLSFVDAATARLAESGMPTPR